MDMMQRRALDRAREALSVASMDAGATRDAVEQDDRHVAELVRAMLTDKEIPRAAQDEHQRLVAAGHVNDRGGVMVPFHRIFGKTFRDLTSGTASGTAKGGNLIGTDVLGLAPELGIYPSVLRAGATVISDLTGDAKLPTLTGGSEPQWLTSETDAPDEGSAVFGSVTLTPHTLSTYIDFSRLLRLQSALSMDGLLRAYLARGIARTVDAAALVGTGADGQPTGIVGTSGVGSVGIATNGGALSRTVLKRIVAEVATDRGLTPESSPAFLANSSTVLSAYATETSSGSGRYLYEPGTDDPTRGTLGGWRCFLNDNLPANGTKGSGSNLSTLVFGDWRALYVGLFGAVELLANPYAAASAGATRLHAYLSLDCAVAQPGAFCVTSDVVTA